MDGRIPNRGGGNMFRFMSRRSSPPTFPAAPASTGEWDPGSVPIVWHLPQPGPDPRLPRRIDASALATPIASDLATPFTDGSSGSGSGTQGGGDSGQNAVYQDGSGARSVR